MEHSFPCYSCAHYVHLYDREDIHTLDDMTDCYYETIPVYGCSLTFDDVDDCKCVYEPKRDIVFNHEF